ncbi:hypothetical protein SAMN04488509_101491 [Aquimonas voraii]|uniref:Uncharacterized protein n=1 Tax=Aquimonas voraii TaxID=265719 RepID=A0A1G6SG77_9GAMM|nr:hypothetical protein SAMN04488509_101491 [Aquimonas voraii]
MKCQHLAPGTRLAFSLVSTLAYCGLLAALFALHPSAVAPIEAMRSPPAGGLAMPLPRATTPGSLKLRMTLPYVPGGGARPADQEI